jgi:hypothetical protein
VNLGDERRVDSAQMSARKSLRWGWAITVLALVFSIAACRHNRFPPRGDAAAVVVAVPRSNAAVPPKVIEREPNDSPEEAQLLAFNPDWPVLSVEGSLSGPGAGKGKDVDVFKVLVPGRHQDPPVPVPALDSAQAEDPRVTARKLALEITAEGGRGLSLQLLDDGLKSLETISVDAGDTAGMPNMAVLPGRTYYFRVKAIAEPAKAAETLPSSQTYKLMVQLGDFELAEEREPNDGMETAQPVVLVGAADFAGFLGWHHDRDYFRISAPEIASALDVEVDALDGVAASLQVLSGSGARIAAGRGRKGERLGLHNVSVPPAAADAGAGAQFLYVVLRGESGQNRTQRYVLHFGMGMLRQDAEIEPNDSLANATPVRDGTITGFLPVGDVDHFRYVGEGQREVTFELACPPHVRGKLEVVRPGDGAVVATAEAKKAKQTVELAKIQSLGEPLLVRVSQGKGDGNPNEPYSLKIGSTATLAHKAGTTTLPSALNPN